MFSTGILEVGNHKDGEGKVAIRKFVRVEWGALTAAYFRFPSDLYLGSLGHHTKICMTSANHIQKSLSVDVRNSDLGDKSCAC